MDRRVRLAIGPAAGAVVFGGIVTAFTARNVLIEGRRPIGWAPSAPSPSSCCTGRCWPARPDTPPTRAQR